MGLKSQIKLDSIVNPDLPPMDGHVYLIDDNEDICRHLSSTLRRFGLSVDSYNNAESFLTSSVEVTPSVILLDMALPGINGLALFEQLKEIGRKTPVIYISGHSAPEEIILAMKQGAFDFLWKPFSIDKLVESVRLALAEDELRISAQVRNMRINDLWETLTGAEKRVARLMLAAHGNSEIAKILNIMPDTVKKHRSRTMDKLGAASLAHMIQLLEGFEIPPEEV